VISQGQNVVKGDRLTVDLTTGTSRVECGKSQGQCRVQALIQPGSMRDKPAADAAAAPAPAPAREAPRKRPSPAAGLY
jgi:lipopolysaccharide export system protein LptA